MSDHKHWTKPLRAAGLLGAGKTGQAVLMLVATALAARTLGVEAFGVLVLIHGLIVAIAKTARFQTWQALIHYGAKAQEAGDTRRLQRVIKFCGLLDVLTGALAFGAVWIASGPAIDLFGLEPELSVAVRAYGSVIVLMVLNGAPNGVLQLYDRFDRIAWQTAAAGFIRFFGSVYLFLSGGGLFEFLVVWYAAEVFAAVVLIVMGLCTLHEKGLVAGLFKAERGLLKPEAGIWRYVFGTQFASTLDLPATHLPVLVVGGVLGPGAAGLYRIANEFASVLLKPGAKLFGRAIYPDLARLLAQDEVLALRKMIVRTGALAGALSLFVFGVFVVFGRQIIILSAGGEFIGAYETMIWLCFAGVVSMFGFGLEPLLISAGRIRETVMARGLATVSFIPALAILLQQYGIAGAGIAGLVYSVLMVVLMAVFGRCLLKG